MKCGARLYLAAYELVAPLAAPFVLRPWCLWGFPCGSKMYAEADVWRASEAVGEESASNSACRSRITTLVALGETVA
jgi:hypothetical protein